MALLDRMQMIALKKWEARPYTSPKAQRVQLHTATYLHELGFLMVCAEPGGRLMNHSRCRLTIEGEKIASTIC